MSVNRARTIRSLLVQLVIACVIPATIMATALLAFDYQRERGRLLRDSIGRARAMVHLIDRELAGVELAAKLLSDSPYLQQNQLALFNDQAQQVLRLSNASHVVLSDTTGQQLLNTLSPLGDKLPKHGNPAQLRKVFDTGSTVVSDVYLSGLLKRLVTSIDVPVFLDGKVAYALSIGMLPERFLGPLAEQRLPPTWIAIVFDRAGVAVARTHEMPRFVGKPGALALVERMQAIAEGSLEMTTLEGIPVLMVFSRAPISHWTVAIGIPSAELDDELQRSLGWLVAGVVFLLVGSLVVAWTVGGRIARSIHGLVGPSLALSAGARVSVPTFNLKEIDEVGQSLTKVSKILADTQARFRATVMSAPTAMVMIDATGTIVLANTEAALLFGYRDQELLGQSIEMLLPDRLRSGHAEMRARFFGVPMARPMGALRDLYARRQDGSEFPVEIGLSPVRTDEKQFVLAAIIDLTERKRQTDTLQRANSALEQSNIELQRFAYVASHDLQTPLRTIGSFVELLRSSYADRLDARGNDWMRRIVLSVENLQTLIRDMLSYSRIDTQPRPFERVSMRDVVDEVVSLIDADIRATGAEVRCGELPAIMGERSQLVQLMLNLIGNAIKYRGDDPPLVEVSAESTGVGVWTLAVRDNGIGIEPRHHQRIFDIFERLHDQRHSSGTGIGLAVCRRVVQRHGGRIWVESTPGRGSVFYFTIGEQT